MQGKNHRGGGGWVPITPRHGGGLHPRRRWRGCARPMGASNGPAPRWGAGRPTGLRCRCLRWRGRGGGSPKAPPPAASATGRRPARARCFRAAPRPPPSQRGGGRGERLPRRSAAPAAATQLHAKYAPPKPPLLAPTTAPAGLEIPSLTLPPRPQRRRGARAPGTVPPPSHARRAGGGANHHAPPSTARCHRQ